MKQNTDIFLNFMEICGFATTLYFTVQRTFTAQDIIAASKETIEGIKDEAYEKGWPKAEVERSIQLEHLYLARDLSLNYLPAFACGIATVGCVVGANHALKTKNAVISSGLSAANMLYDEYHNAVNDILGERKNKEIESKIKERRVNEAPVKEIKDTGLGDTLCAIEVVPGDKDTMIFFRSSPQAVESARNECNAYMLENDGEITQADLLYFLGIKLRGRGAQIRYHKMHSRDDLIHFKYDSFVHNKTGEPVLFVDTRGIWES